MSAAKKEERDAVSEAARDALSRANNDVQKAAKLLEEAVRSRPKLREAITDPLIVEACYDAVRAQTRVARKVIWNPPSPSLPRSTPKAAVLEQASRVIHLASGTLLMFPLPGGKRLGDATRGEISEAAGFYERQGRDMADKARWLRLVAQSVTGKKTASEVLSDTRLRELQVEARRGK